MTSSSKLKILFISDQLGADHGSSKSAIDIIRSIKTKVTLSVLSISGHQDLGRRIRAFNAKPIKQLIGNSRLKRVLKLTIVTRFVNSLDFIILLLYFKNREYDALLINGYGSEPIWRFARKAISKKASTILISRESPRHFSQKDRLIDVGSQISFISSFKFVIFVSKILQDEWGTLAELNPEHTFYLPNCCEEQSFLSISNDSKSKDVSKKNLGINPNSYVILNVGGIELRKGHEDLFRLAKRLKCFIPNFVIACVGPTNTESGKLFKQKILDSEIADNFIFVGSTQNTHDWYSCSNMLVFTSRAEAMPRTILEAMASNLPIVSTNVDGIPELLIHEESGLLYNPGDIETLEKHVRSIIENTNYGDLLGTNARQRYTSCYTQANHQQRLSIILDQIQAYIQSK